MHLVSPSRLAWSRGISSRVLLQVRNSQPSEFTAFHPQLQFRRHYRRMLRTIVSKHITSITDAVRPVLPPSIASLPREVDKIARTFSPAHNQELRDVPKPASEQDPESPEDDVSTEPYSAATPDTNVQTQVRKLMRLVPHPVAIITATQPNSRADSAFRGMTVSSFNTVTLYPEPIVSFNVKLPSETYDAIRSSQRFLVHLLSSNGVTANLAREFSRGHENVQMEDRKHTFRFTSPASLERQPAVTEGEPPRLVLQQRLLDNEDSTQNTLPSNFPFILECRYYPSSARVGDHVIVLGTVIKIYSDEPRQLDINHTADDLCLTYADTRFWKMGEQITLLSKKDRP
ncbi:predicted protein [Uncinocarpus reesii 1704]|uniref:Flavin reductase like domain-containing protein n=1 Tax=Uncinocarpus reesii (strain UAMH 1704) TaxID=336963 RepID=C4JKR9_UNCRE|nr:uncharacterized protein UREG_00615 [Uncinocarpus reesii 1704]EEP75768.1 predicted protein [Uncinocarpus reesii 1704]